MIQIATEIIPDLWIGNHESIEDLIFLNENKFSLIINCTKDIEFNKHYTNCENIRLPIDDQPHRNLFQSNIDLYNKLDDVVEYIHEYLGQNKSVLIFCREGRQRSPTVVAGYIMKYGRVNSKQAIEYIRSKRSNTFEPKINFHMTLQKFEKKSMINL